MSKKSDDVKKVRCSFCGRTQDEVRRIIAGPGVYICNECIDLCQSIIDEEFESEYEHFDASSIDLPTPKEIVEKLTITS